MLSKQIYKYYSYNDNEEVEEEQQQPPYSVLLRGKQQQQKTVLIRRSVEGHQTFFQTSSLSLFFFLSVLIFLSFCLCLSFLPSFFLVSSSLPSLLPSCLRSLLLCSTTLWSKSGMNHTLCLWLCERCGNIGNVLS